MNDPHISYQNVRRVNLPAYKLLIVVAAVIQIVIIQDELTQKSRSVRRAEGKLSRSRYLLRAVGGPRKPSPEDFDEELEETKEPPSRADTDVTAVDAEGDGPIVLTEEDFADDASVFDDDQDGIGIPNTEDIDMDEDLDEDFEEMATA